MESKEGYVYFQVIGASLSYIILMIISFFKDFDISGINIMFSSMILFSCIYRIFIFKSFSSKSSKIFTRLFFVGSLFIMIGNFQSILG